jgi:hypothetical protein
MFPEPRSILETPASSHHCIENICGMSGVRVCGKKLGSAGEIHLGSAQQI